MNYFSKHTQTNFRCIAPNPASDFAKINFNNLPVNTSITLYDLTGRLLNKFSTLNNSGSWDIDTTEMPKGIYLIVARDKDAIIYQQKLIIK